MNAFSFMTYPDLPGGCPTPKAAFDPIEAANIKPSH
jgi:hypothetical protein